MRLLAALVLLMAQQAAQAPAPAAPPAPHALSTTLRLTIAKVDVPADTPPSPLGNLGPLIAQLLTPEGPVEIEYLVSGNSTRGEIRGRLAAFTRGTIVLQDVREDSLKVLNPANRTWYTLPASGNLGAMIGTPDVQLQPTGETATIAGQRAERYRFSETMRIPVPEGVNLPPDIPRDIELSGDVWSTDAFAGSGYAAIFRTLQAAAAVPGMEALTAGGKFPLRIAVRSSVMPGYEIRSEVISVAPASPASSVFVVPSGYQQIQSPVGGVPK
jgi:hypothetical protein